MMSETKRKTDCDNHLQSILRSGLILDDDIDYILMHYLASDEPDNNITLSSLHKWFSGFCFATSLLLLYQKCPWYSMAFSASPLVLVGGYQMREALYRKNQKKNMEMLIQAICDLRKMNCMICEYFNLRNISRSASGDILSPYTKSIKQLIEIIFQTEVNILYAFRFFIWQFGTYVPSLKLDYEYLDTIELEQFVTSNVTCINDCVIYLQKLCDIFVLVTSNCLTCLAVLISPNTWTLHNYDIDEAFDTFVPKMKKMSVDSFSAINKKFNDVKYYYLNRRQIKEQLKPLPPNAFSKLYSSTSSILVHSSEILEKSQIILKQLKKHNELTIEEKIQISNSIANLYSEVFDYYESLDVLHKLYEVNINSSKLHTEFKVETRTESLKDTRSIENNLLDVSFNSVEPSDDEVFELFIGINDESSDELSFSYYEEQESNKLASVLGRELKQKLKTHSRFIAARQKSGIVDEEPLEEVPVVTEVGQTAVLTKVPKIAQEKNLQIEFESLVPELPLPISTPHLLPTCENNKTFASPPPPPLPPLHWSSFEEKIEPTSTVHDFLESIKTAAECHKSEEVVFVSSDTEE